MNSTHQMVIDVLQLEPLQAIDVLHALRKGGRQLTIEALYVELVAMESAELVRVEPFCVGGQQAGCMWALGRCTPKLEPEIRSIAGMKAEFLNVQRVAAARTLPAVEETPGGLIHRCR